MTIELIIPEGTAKDKTTKDLVFSILSEDYPKTLTQLHREIKRSYGVSVTFQAVLKAANALLAQKVLEKQGKLYSIDKDWVFETRKFLDVLYAEYFKVKKPLRKVELGKEVTIYTLTNLLELDRLWNDLLTSWARTEQEDKRNTWQGKHCWWLIPRLQEEDILHDLFAKHKIKTYNLLTESTPLDKIAIRYYTKRKEFIKATKKLKLPQGTNISAFGQFLMKFEIPKELSNKLEGIYLKTKRIEQLDIKKVFDIFKENHEIEVTLIKDKMLTDKIKEEIIAHFK